MLWGAGRCAGSISWGKGGHEGTQGYRSVVGRRASEGRKAPGGRGDAHDAVQMSWATAAGPLGAEGNVPFSGGPMPALGPVSFPGTWDCFHCFSWGWHRAGFGSRAVVCSWGWALHFRWQRGKFCHPLVIRVSQLMGMGTGTMQKRMSPKSPAMRPWSSISLCKAHRDLLCACQGCGCSWRQCASGGTPLNPCWVHTCIHSEQCSWGCSVPMAKPVCGSSTQLPTGPVHC